MKLSISGEVERYLCDYGGNYFLKEDVTNGKPYWIHQSGGKAIWWDSPNPPSWIVGDFEDLGSSTASIIGPSNNDSPPNQINNGWQYANFASKEWVDTKGLGI